ncbi:MAG: FAD binding domain-containing protein [Spirochaetales bacterium]|nr:FAD binding domain-containing protein [Spirochaetales bacterium]
MKSVLKQTNIYVPTSLRELSMLCQQFPDALLFAGGTHIMRSAQTTPGSIISLNKIKDLLKIRRKETYLDIGSCVTFSRIVSLGAHVVPTALFKALSEAVTPSIMNLATIGGNICTASYTSDVLTPLALYDAKIEIRSSSGIHWLPVMRFVQGNGRTLLKAGEFVSTVRIPFEEWDIQSFLKLDITPSPKPSILKCAAAVKISKTSINDLRMVFGGVEPIILRSRELEGILIGNKLPLQNKSMDFFCSEFTKLLDSAGSDFLPNPYHTRTAIRFARHFLSSLNSTNP